jgi:hypothetical protein
MLYMRFRVPGSGRVVPEYQDEQVRERLEGTYRVIYEIMPITLTC